MGHRQHTITIASRQSPLARVQAQAVGLALAEANPGLTVHYRWVASAGDRFADTPLSEVGGKGLFTSEVERVVLAGEADLAVHSLKDMPCTEAEVTPGLTLAAVPSRADARDCLIAPDITDLRDLPQGAVVGTASPRRAAQIKRLRPDIHIQLIRGNIQTRLRKVLDEAQMHATLLAVAGLERMGLSQHARCPIEPSQVLPAAGQGALAIQCREDDDTTLGMCRALNDPVTAAAVHAERRVVAALQGDCHSAIAVFAQPVDTESEGKTELPAAFRLRSRVLSLGGRICLETDGQALRGDLDRLVNQVVQQLRHGGAEKVLADREP